jgi:hypothetical protein
MSPIAVVHTGKDGALVEGSKEAVDDVFTLLSKSKKIVLYFHGGLDDARTGMAIGEKLDPVFQAAGAVPVFFVWESGLLEILKGNIKEIAGENLFGLVLKYVLKFAGGKLNEAEGAGGRGLGLEMPTDIQIHSELSKLAAKKEPFGQRQIPDDVQPLTSEERTEFEDRLAEDAEFQATAAAILNDTLDEPRVDGARGLEITVRSSEHSLVSPDIVEELKGDAKDAGGRGLFASAQLIKHATAILVRVVQRFRARRDHGVYPTVVEEILREFYVANVGVRIWGAMKGETGDTFSSEAPLRGGYYFAEKLAALAFSGVRPEISLIGHSTGAVFINNLLKHVNSLQAANPPRYPTDYLFKNIVFLAPACTFDEFSRYVAAPYHSSTNGGPGLYENFRMYIMSDEAECNDQLVPHVYTRSLLYFVSGVLEPSASGKSAPDVPIVGLQRYYTGKEPYTENSIAAVRSFVTADMKRAVYSPTAVDLPGLSSRALHHGDFDDDSDTLKSVQRLVGEGY